MNQKITLYTDHHDYCYCIISKENNIKEEFEKVFSIKKGYGFSIDVYPDLIKLVDYFHGEIRAECKIVSIEDTDEDLIYHLKKLEV